MDAWPARDFQAKVKQIRKAPETIQNVVTYTVVLAAKNDDYALLPGMTALTRIVTGRARAKLSVPLAALRFSPSPGGAAKDGSSVWVLKDGHGPVPVRLGLGDADDSRAVVEAGNIHVDDEVIVGYEPDGGAAAAGERRWP